MNLNDILWLSYKDLKEKRVRTVLTIAMVMIGVAAIVALTSITAGISASITSELQSLGPTSIILQSTKATGFTGADTSLLSSLPNVTAVIPVVEGSATITTSSGNLTATLIGISAEGLQQFVGGNVSLYQGTIYSDSIAPEMLVGHSIAFPSSSAGAQSVTVGQPLSVTFGGGRSAYHYTVPATGILNAFGSSIVPIDTSLITSLQAAETLLHRSSYSTILVKASSTASVAPLSSEITNIYGSSVNVLTTQQILATVSTVIGGISLLFSIIAGVSLLVAAIGIMNIMLIAVFERTHEIGIMKSVGFRNRNILSIFLFQALIIGVVGGVAGIGSGAVVSYGLSVLSNHSSATPTSQTASPTRAGAVGGGAVYVSGGDSRGSGSPAQPTSSTSFSFRPAFPPLTILTAMVVAVLVSVAAGIYPAWRASKMEPIDALRQL